MARPPTFEELLRGTRHSAVHPEARDVYMPSDPAYAEWLNGVRDPAQEEDPEFQDWLRWVREATNRGVDLRRARVVSVPESEYIRFEYFVTDANVGAGEKARWLPRRQATDISFPGNDFWVFDNEFALILHFDGTGEPAPDWMELTTTPAVVRLCATAFEAAWARAVPHGE